MTISTNQMHVQVFKDSIIHAVQQEVSYLETAIMRKETFNGEAFYFDKLGTVSLNKKTSIYQPTTFADALHTKRKLSFDTFDQALRVDKYDADRSMISGLSSDYMLSLKYAINRKKDQLIIAAATGSAFEGKDGSTVVAFNDAKQTVFADGSYGTDTAGTAVSLTTNKLLTGLKILRKNQVQPNEKIYCFLSAEEENALMKDDKAINRDFTNGQVLDKGIIGTWAGINFIRTEELLDSAVNTNRDVILMTELALGMGNPGNSIVSRIDERPDLKYLTQVYVEMNMGCTRVEDEKVVKIICKKD
jgi:hypothetical protein